VGTFFSEDEQPKARHEEWDRRRRAGSRSVIFGDDALATAKVIPIFLFFRLNPLHGHQPSVDAAVLLLRRTGQMAQAQSERSWGNRERQFISSHW
jgi:hypothetical protein